MNVLAQRENLQVLRDGLYESLDRWVRATGGDRRVRSATIDIESFAIEVYGRQEGTAYNGHYQAVTYHRLVASFCVGGHYDSAREGCRMGNGFLLAILCQGNAHPAAGIREFLKEVIAKARELAWSLDVRFDAGLTEGVVLDDLTEASVRFVGRLKSNARLEAMAEPYMQRPAVRGPKEGL